MKNTKIGKFFRNISTRIGRFFRNISTRGLKRTLLPLALVGTIIVGVALTVLLNYLFGSGAFAVLIMDNWSLFILAGLGLCATAALIKYNDGIGDKDQRWRTAIFCTMFVLLYAAIANRDAFKVTGYERTVIEYRHRQELRGMETELRMLKKSMAPNSVVDSIQRVHTATIDSLQNMYESALAACRSEKEGSSGTVVQKMDTATVGKVDTAALKKEWEAAWILAHPPCPGSSANNTGAPRTHPPKKTPPVIKNYNDRRNRLRFSKQPPRNCCSEK